MQYFMPEIKGGRSWSVKPAYYSETMGESNAVLGDPTVIGSSPGSGDFTIEALFRISDMTNAQNKYSTFLAFDRSNLSGEVLDLMFTDTGFGGYVGLVFSNGGDQSATSNHVNTFTLELTRTDFDNRLRHLAFVRRSSVLTAYVDGIQVKLRKGFNAYATSVSSVAYSLQNINNRRNTRAGNTGDISKVYTETYLTGFSYTARYSGNFVPPIDLVLTQERATVLM